MCLCVCVCVCVVWVCVCMCGDVLSCLKVTLTSLSPLNNLSLSLSSLLALSFFKLLCLFSRFSFSPSLPLLCWLPSAHAALAAQGDLCVCLFLSVCVFVCVFVCVRARMCVCV